MSLQVILESVKANDAKRNEALINAPYYPEVFLKDDGVEARIAALVRIEKDGVWYAVPVYNTMIYTERDKGAKVLWKQFIQACQMVQYCYKLCGMEKVDSLQISEKERLILKYNKQ